MVAAGVGGEQIADCCGAVGKTDGAQAGQEQAGMRCLVVVEHVLAGGRRDRCEARESGRKVTTGVSRPSTDRCSSSDRPTGPVETPCRPDQCHPRPSSANPTTGRLTAVHRPSPSPPPASHRQASTIHSPRACVLCSSREPTFPHARTRARGMRCVSSQRATMDDVLSAQFDRVEKALSTLVDSIAAYNPSPQAALDLVAADDELSHGLDQRTWTRRASAMAAADLARRSCPPPGKPRPHTVTTRRGRCTRGAAQGLCVRPGKPAP